jgi:hypothetical protein
MMRLLRSWFGRSDDFPGATVAENRPVEKVRRLSQASIGGQTPCPWLML